MTVYGYARASTDGQTLAVQDAQLRAAGVAKTYSEKVPGPSATGRSWPSCSNVSTRATCWS